MKLGEVVLCSDCNEVFDNHKMICPSCTNRLNLVPITQFFKRSEIVMVKKEEETGGKKN